MEVEQTTVSGVPAFLAPGDGSAHAALVFRVGTSDETLTTSGITHLVEHLAMHALGRTSYTSNAFVDATRTVFFAHGTPEEVTAFVGAVASALVALPLHRLELEQRVLLTEAARRSRGPQEELLLYRFGPRTYGLRAYDEHGLRTQHAEDVQRWAARGFTRGNAAVWSSVPLPDDLLDPLPEGQRHLPPDPHSIDPLPARFGSQAALGLDAVVARSTAAMTAWRLLRNRVFDVLRTEHAVVYDVGIDTERIGRASRRFVLLCDPLPEVRYQAGKLLTTTLEAVLQEGFPETDVRDDVTTLLRHWDEPGALLAQADAAAFDTLVGTPLRTSAELRAEAEALTAEAVLAAVREAAEAMLLVVPDEVVTTLPVRPVDRWSSARTQGRSFLPSHGLATTARGGATRRLVVGDTGVTLAFSAQDAVTVVHERCEAVLRWDDGTRRLIGTDGFQLQVAPWEWQDGDDAVRDLDGGVPAPLVVAMGAGEGPPADWPAAPPPPPPPPSPLRKWPWWLLWAVSSLLMVTIALAPVEIGPSDDAGPYAGYGCGPGTAIEIALDDPRFATPDRAAREQLLDACRGEARAQLVASGLGLVSLVWCLLVGARQVRRAVEQRRPAPAKT